MARIWFITGSSRGLGRSLATAVLKNGDKVAATARNTGSLNELVDQYPDAVFPIELDVNDKGQVRISIGQGRGTFWTDRCPGE